MDQNPKQAIVEKVKSANSVLVTVSTNPSVDQLSAAIGMTLMLSALDIKSTAVFSGEVPNVIEFLEPEKNLNKDVNALRDFIISIDKEKADKLRYKVEDNVVKIFITPYKTTLSESDLEFTQGDINVDLVIALGVHNRDDLDQAIVSHGRILHDATIASITAGTDGAPELGSINWHDASASCLSEMLVSVSEALQSGILDKAMSTAFLTGIVAATERFSNDKTTPKVMTMSAQLMAAGADQQLIARNLRMDRGRTAPPVQAAPSGNQHQDDTVLDLHSEHNQPSQAPESIEELEQELEADSVQQPDQSQPDIDSNQNDKIIDSREMIKEVKTIKDDDEEEPALGGTFNATSQAVHEAAKQEREKNINKAILSHENTSAADKPPLQSAQPPAVEIPGQEVPTEPLPPPPPVEMPQQPAPAPSRPSVEPTPPPPPQPAEQPAPPEEPDPIEEARKAVERAVGGQDFDPAHHPIDSVGAQPMENNQININPTGEISPIGDQPAQPTINPLQAQVDEAVATPDSFSLPKLSQPQQPQPEPVTKLPEQPTPPNIELKPRHMATPPPPDSQQDSDMPLGVTQDDEDKPVDNTFLVSPPEPGKAAPGAPPPLPPNPGQSTQNNDNPPQNPLFNQQ